MQRKIIALLALCLVFVECKPRPEDRPNSGGWNSGSNNNRPDSNTGGNWNNGGDGWNSGSNNGRPTLTTEVIGTMEVMAGTVEATIMAGLILILEATGTMEEMTGTLEVTMEDLTPILEETGTMEATMAGTVETTTTTGQTPMDTGTMAMMVTIQEEDPQNLLLKRVRLMLESSL